MIRPIRDGVLVRPCKSDEKSTGGIIVPDSFKAVSNRVEVVAVGNGIKERPMKFRAGDIVCKIKGCGTEILVNGELHLLIKDNWILTKLN
jgi:chaperonin GroES